MQGFKEGNLHFGYIVTTVINMKEALIQQMRVYKCNNYKTIHKN